MSRFSSEWIWSSDKPSTEFDRCGSKCCWLVAPSPVGAFENRCEYVNTMESFSIELSDGRILRSKVRKMARDDRDSND